MLLLMSKFTPEVHTSSIYDLLLRISFVVESTRLESYVACVNNPVRHIKVVVHVYIEKIKQDLGLASCLSRAIRVLIRRDFLSWRVASGRIILSQERNEPNPRPRESTRTEKFVDSSCHVSRKTHETILTWSTTRHVDHVGERWTFRARETNKRVLLLAERH